MTEVDHLNRELLATQAELAQLRRLERIADSDLVRLALSAWAALADEPEMAQMLEDLPAVISSQPRQILRMLARANLTDARLRDALADHWSMQRVDGPSDKQPYRDDAYSGRIMRLRFEAMVRRFKAWVMLQAAKEKR